MTEVAEVGEPHAAIANDVRDLRDIERLIRQGVRAVADEEEDDRSAHRSEQRCHRYVDAPVRRTDRIHQIGRRFPERQRADQHAEGESSAGAEPCGDDLHPRRVDTGEEDPGGQAKPDRGRSGMDEPRENRVHRCAGER
jgi:hypothetical protein